MDSIWMIIFLIFLIVFAAVVCFLLWVQISRQKQLEKMISDNQRNTERNSQIVMNQTASQIQQVSQQLLNLASGQGKSSSLIQQLYGRMDDMNRIMNNTKRRGNWGEYQMETLIRLYLGDSPAIYRSQVTLENKAIADGAFQMPGTDRLLCIDSKFPMENFLAMSNEPESAEYFKKEFRKNMRKHINDVADKYINVQTVDQAILFLPSEAVYQFVCGECEDLLHHALSRHVLLCGPTTLAGVVFTIQSGTRDFYRAQNLKNIEKDLLTLQKSLHDLQQQHEKVIRQSRTLQNSAEETARNIEKAVQKLDKALNTAGNENDSLDYLHNQADTEEALDSQAMSRMSRFTKEGMGM